MEINRQPDGTQLKLSLKGRLDAYWSAHLTSTLEEAIRGGHHRIDLNFSEVEYMSSAGIAVLMNFYKQLRAIKGSLTICSASKSVKAVLDLCAMSDLFMTAATPEATVPTVSAPACSTVCTASAELQCTTLTSGASMQLAYTGRPETMAASAFTESDCRMLAFPSRSIGLGLGAFGSGFGDCRGRFGEFLALGGAAAFLPTDGATVPDYIVSTAGLMPQVQSLHALRAEGTWSHLVRFDAKPGTAVTLGELLPALSRIAGGTNGFALAMLAETSSIVGACLQRSPALNAAGTSRFDFPGVRDWLTFTTERAHERTLCAVTGIAVPQPGKGLASFLRPVGAGPDLPGHFHAAIFPYQPLPRTGVQLDEMIPCLFDSGTMLGVMHLLADDREFAGVGQSEFWRGTCWIAPLKEGGSS